MINCNYKVKITDIQNKYRFKIFCATDLSGYYTKDETDTLLNGKQNTIDSSHKLNADLVDDTNSTNKFVSASEKAQITTNATDIEELQEENENLNLIVDQMPKVTDEGEIITLNNTISARMNIGLKGNTSQDGEPTPDNPVNVNVVSGDNEIIIASNDLLDNATLTSGGYIDSNDTIVSNVGWKYSDYIDISNYEYYIVDGYIGNTPKSIIYNASKTPIKVIDINKNTKETYAFSNYAGAKYIRISTTDSALSKQHIVKMQEYPLYLPVENLLEQNRTTTTINGVSFTIQDDGSVKCENQATEDANLDIGRNIGNTFKAGTYTASGCPDNGSSSTFGVAIYKVVNGTATKITDLFGKSIDVSTFTLDSECEVFYRISIKSGYNPNGIVYKPQIEPGTKQNRYTPYGVQPITLNKIGNYQDKIVKTDKWYWYREIGEVVLNGSENWHVGANGTNSYSYFLNTMKLSSSSTPNPIYVMTNLFKGVSFDDRSSSGNNITYADTSAYNGLYIRNTSYTSLSDFKTMLNTKNMVVNYVLATPTYTEITDTTLISQLNAIEKAISYSSQTNIAQTNADKPFVLDASALLDLNTLINAIVSLGGDI